MLQYYLTEKASLTRPHGYSRNEHRSINKLGFLASGCYTNPEVRTSPTDKSIVTEQEGITHAQIPKASPCPEQVVAFERTTAMLD
jgi:hypothetical protein